MAEKVSPVKDKVNVGLSEIYQIGELDGVGERIVTEFVPGKVTFCNWHTSVPGLTNCHRCPEEASCPIPPGVKEERYPRFH